MRFCSLLVVFIVLSSVSVFSQNTPPKIGLVLSGGGAKGLAHIGVLEVLDEIGLKVDYISGTSMGSIIGALYAAGYSADSIRKIARNEKWEMLLTNSVPVEYLSPDVKPEYGNYNLEIGFDKGKITTPIGLLDGHLLGLELSKLMQPVADIRKFTEFPIPFTCIATNIETGRIEVLDSGNIVEALKASMAIPSLFKPVVLNGKVLVDGGVLRNFPVTNAKDMGASIIVGVNVGAGILPAHKLRSIPSVLFQSIFLGGNIDFVRQRDEVDYLIEPEISDYSAADFLKVDPLIAAGKAKAEALKHKLIQLRDSLNALYPNQYIKNVTFPKVHARKFEEIKIIGLRHYTAEYVVSSLSLAKEEEVDLIQLQDKMNHLVGTRNFRNVSYEIASAADGKGKILIIYVEEAPKYTAQVDLNYNTFFKASLLLRLTARNLFLPSTKLVFKANVGDNIRLDGVYSKEVGRKRRGQIYLEGYQDEYDFPTNVSSSGKPSFQRLDKLRTYAALIGIKQRLLVHGQIAAGLKREFTIINNLINTQGGYAALKSSNYAVYFDWNYNNENKVVFPTKGWKITLGAQHIFHYRFQHSEPASLAAVLPSMPAVSPTFVVAKSFEQFHLSISNRIKIHENTAVLNSLHSGITLGTQVSYSHFYRVGGVRENFRNNVPFVGIKEFHHLQSPFLLHNICKYELGIQQQIFRGLYIVPRASAATVAADWKELNHNLQEPVRMLLGTGVTLAYESPGGVLEVTLMHANQFRDVAVYVNLGGNFFNR